MTKKKVITQIKLQISAGQANPAPPVGPALGQHGVNIMEFCKNFNAATANKTGTIIPVVISVYEDKSFTFIMKSPPCSALLKQACGLAKGSGKPNKEKIGRLSKAQIREIAKTKAKDLNSFTDEEADRIVEGTARSMGIVVEG